MKVIYKMIPYYTPETEPLFYCIVPILCILCTKMDRMAAVECRCHPEEIVLSHPHLLGLSL